MSAVGRARWSELWRGASARADMGTWFDRLTTLYSQAHRHYHGIRHIEKCLAEFDAARHLAEDHIAVELAIWFHDALYDPRATDNEERSAIPAEECLSEGGTSGHLRAAVTDLVLATKTHEVSGQVDAQLLVDVDLSILGKPEPRFLEYEAQIRGEYDWVPDIPFVTRRAEILERFLARERIYTTEHFFRTYERQARSNLQASIGRLRGAIAGQPGSPPS